MKKNPLGFTLIELMVTISLLSVLMLVAAPSFIDYQRSSILSSQSNSFLGALQTAKNEAIKRNSHSYITPLTNDDWNTGWIIFSDDDLSGSYEENNDQKIAEFSNISELLEISGNGTASNTNGKYISFNASGYPRTSSNAMANFSMTLKLKGSESNIHKRLVIVSKTGRIRTCRPAQDSNCQ